jgi:heme A synthase
MYDGLLHLHSGLRWIALLALIYAIFNAWTRYRGGNTYRGTDKALNTVAMALLHTQVVIGLTLYFLNFSGNGGKYQSYFSNAGNAMSDSVGRFFVMEHLVMMLAAVVFATIGYLRAKRAEDPKKMHRRIFVWYTIVLLIILAAIPWPFRFENSGWF